MKYIVDNDLHIHSWLSSCSSDAEQTATRMLEYAEENGLKTICVTDHFWDEAVGGANSWYATQNYEHISLIKPLPKKAGIEFLFGCEAELDGHLRLALSKERYNQFDFIVVPTTHFHMSLIENEGESAKSRADAWVRRLDAVLNMGLPFHKVGIAHLTCPLIARTREEYLEILELIPDSEMIRLFSKAAQLGVGIELNAGDMNFAEEEADVVLKPYRIAKRCGCKFYLGSDAHHPDKFEWTKSVLERAIELLELEEKDKFVVGKRG